MIRNSDVDDLSASQFIKEFNIRFYNPEHYDGTKPRHPFLLEYEENRRCEAQHLRNILNFCINSDIYKTLGLSFKDVMYLDVATFEVIQEEILKADKIKGEALDKMMREQKTKSDDLMKTIKNRQG